MRSGAEAGHAACVDLTTPLDRLPELEAVPPPRVGASTRRALERTRAALLSTPGGYDAPALIALEASAEAIAVYEAFYSWGVVSAAGAPELGLGMLGVKVLLEQDGQAIWQRRARGVAEGLSWDLSSGGGVDPGEDLQAAAVRETVEELGVEERQLGALRPLVLAHGPRVGAQVVFVARLDPDAILAPDVVEVSEIARVPWGRIPVWTWTHCARVIAPAVFAADLSRNGR